MISNYTVEIDRKEQIKERLIAPIGIESRIETYAYTSTPLSSLLGVGSLLVCGVGGGKLGGKANEKEGLLIVTGGCSGSGSG